MSQPVAQTRLAWQGRGKALASVHRPGVWRLCAFVVGIDGGGDELPVLGAQVRPWVDPVEPRHEPVQGAGHEGVGEGEGGGLGSLELPAHRAGMAALAKVHARALSPRRCRRTSTSTRGRSGSRLSVASRPRTYRSSPNAMPLIASHTALT